MPRKYACADLPLQCFVLMCRNLNSVSRFARDYSAHCDDVLLIFQNPFHFLQGCTSFTAHFPDKILPLEKEENQKQEFTRFFLT